MALSKVANRLSIAGAATLAATLIAVPTVVGLHGNSSFTRDIPVPVPSGAHRAVFTEPQPSGSRRTMDDHPGRQDRSSAGNARDDRTGNPGSDDPAGDRHGSDDPAGDRHGSDDPAGHRHGSDDPAGDRHGSRRDD
jgi:hypothetical protein